MGEPSIATTAYSTTGVWLQLNLLKPPATIVKIIILSFCELVAVPLMETWDVVKTAAWLCEIKIDKKYGAICHKENINGRALLLLASKNLEQLVSVFQFKMGPQMKLMDGLQSHLKAFNIDKPQTVCCSEKVMREWTVERLCDWLRELGIPGESIVEAENEEIDGQAFLLCKESGKLKECLQLKVGSLIVLEHELALHSEKSGNIVSYANAEMPTAESTRSQAMSGQDDSMFETKESEESKEPLAANDPTFTTTSVLETPPKVRLSKEEERLVLLQNALQLDIEASTGAEDVKECIIQSFFVKRGKGANSLEALFTFIVITKDEMTVDKPRKLWSKLREKTEDWVKLLPAKDSQSFLWDRESESFFHVPSKEKVSLRDGKVVQIFLEKLSDNDYKQNLFVVLVDKQLFEEKKTTYKFCLDKKRKHFFIFKLNVKESKYHASFDATSLGQDLKFSQHFRSLMGNAADFIKAVSHPSPSEPKPSSSRDVPRRQTPRPFSSEFAGKYYNKGFMLDSWETGPKNLIKPAREFKLLRIGVNNTEDDCIKKFVYETLRFACGCLNERTNGTIHFGVADEVEEQTCGYQPRKIVGCSITKKPRYNDKLTEFIDKCFVGDSRSNVHNCIRPPVFIPVKAVDVEVGSNDTEVIEVDIEPRYSLCEGEIFKVDFKCLGRGRDGGDDVAYIRRGSKTEAIVKLKQLENYLKIRMPKLDEERKCREEENNSIQRMEKQDSHKHLYGKLMRLVCANKKVLDSSVYPILVLSKPDVSMDQDFLNRTFKFIRNIKWQVIIDFDDQGSDSIGLCSVFKSAPDSPHFDIHEAEDYDRDESVIKSIHQKTHWIFGNGYTKLGKGAVGFKQWNNSKRKRGLTRVIQSLARKIPNARAVVLFLIFSKECETMADTFKDFCTNFDGPNQLVYVAKNSETVTDWVTKLSSTCLEDHQLRERGVVGMSWEEFQGCMQQMIQCGIERHDLYVTMTTGNPYPLKDVPFNNISIVSAKECDELVTKSSAERWKISSGAEIDFYSGLPVTWTNFFFTDAGEKHVLRRDNYSKLKGLIENSHSRGSEGKVQTITIYHHIGAGASTMARQALWDFRCDPDFPCRCAVVIKVDDNTCKDILLLRNAGYGEDSEEPCLPPVLALVEDTDDFLFRELRSQVVEHANRLPQTEWPVCVFLYCKATPKPREYHLKEEKPSVFLEQHLSQEEVDWFKGKYTEMKMKFDHKDPEDSERDFGTYANENLISFMIMKGNFNPAYASSIVERNLSEVTSEEMTLLEYTSLLNLYNPYPVFAASFDTIMLSASFLRKKMFRHWSEDLTHSARIFLREMDVSAHLGTGRTIAVVHPIIANELLDKIARIKETSVSQIALDFLESPLLDNQGKQFTTTYLYDGANKMLKHRKKFEYGDNEQTQFSPLIEKILKVKEADDGEKQATEESVYQAAEVLKKGLEKFKDPMLAQQMARVFYVNVVAFSKPAVDSCFSKAFEFCERAIRMAPGNSFLFDTMGRIYKSKIKYLFGSIRGDNRVIEIADVTPVLPLAFEAIKWFQKSWAAAADNHNNSGLHGELSVMFYLLDVLYCTEIFRGQEGLKRLQRYLAFSQEIPNEVQEPWSEFHEDMKDLRNRFSHCMERLTEDFAVYKGNNFVQKSVPSQIDKFSRQFLSYFGQNEIDLSTDSPEVRWEFRWSKINQYLAGGIFSRVFALYRSGGVTRETLQELEKLALENYGEPVHKERYNDLLLMIVTRMARHSPKGKPSETISDSLVDEYAEIYKHVEKLFALEKCDKGHQRLYAHLFKVMFLWPREDLELSNYRVQDFYHSLKKLKERWDRKCRGQTDPDKLQKQKLYKYMSFKKEARQYTTLFYLGVGSGLDVFVHVNELTGEGSLDWKNQKTKGRLKRLTGVVESENIIRIQNPLDSNKTIDVYYFSREGGFLKEEVTFYLGFSWAHLIAFDVKYTNMGIKKHFVELSDPVSDTQLKPFSKRGDLTYVQYSRQLFKLEKKLQEIGDLRKIKKDGQELDETQVINDIFFSIFYEMKPLPKLISGLYNANVQVNICDTQ